MYYKTLSEWEYSSLKRDLERSLSSLSDATRNMESLKRDVDAQMRDYKYAEQSLVRAWEDKLKDEVKKVGTKTGYSSYSYSSYDSKIRDSQRIMERCLTKVSDCVSKMADTKRQIDTFQREATNKLAVLTNTYEGLVKQLDSTTKDLKKESLRSEALSKEKAIVEREKAVSERESRRQQQKMQSEMECFKRNAVVAGAAAAAFTAEVTGKADAATREIRRLEAERREWEQKTAEMKSYYESEIANLKAMVDTAGKSTPAGSSTLDGLAYELESALQALGSKTKAVHPAPVLKPKESSREAPQRKAPKPKVDVLPETVSMTAQRMASLASDYAVLWNEIMEDDIIELREVIRIKEWVRVHAMNVPEGVGLLDWCEAVLSRKSVAANDAQALYDRSFMLLKALGAKIG